ncbi:hypothetical protein ILYODFUR_019245 [Ilyodon furcidens]|uniref:Uncharacterized protein n=1 Tax=Ilyodon furcidens TaxID=33524 RepID=A0ABV0VFA6_9TELE
MNFTPVTSFSVAASNRLFLRVGLYLPQSIFLSTLTNCPLSSEENHLLSMMLPPPSFTLGMVSLGSFYNVFFFLSSPFARVVECTTKSCLLKRFPKVSCESQHLLQSYPNSFHLWMLVQEMFCPPDLCAVLLALHDAVCSVMSSNKPHKTTGFSLGLNPTQEDSSW